MIGPEFFTPPTRLIIATQKTPLSQSGDECSDYSLPRNDQWFPNVGFPAALVNLKRKPRTLSPRKFISEVKKDNTDIAEYANRQFRDALRLGNPLAREDTEYFVLSVGGNDGRICIAESFDTAVEAIGFALKETKEARLWSDEIETTTRYYPFQRSR